MTEFYRVTDDVDDNLAEYHNELIDGLQAIPGPDGWMQNGKLSVTVSSNDLVVALKTKSGTDPSVTDPIAICINGTVRSVTAATSITLADATNWMGLGGAMFATLENDLFAYAVWDSNSSIVALSVSRYPGGCVVSDFNSTNTHEKYLGNYANFTSTDDVVVIGRFAATLSAGAGYTWTVPTFTSANLIHYPIYETRVTAYTPTETGFSSTTINIGRYQVIRNRVKCSGLINGTSDGTTLVHGAPFTSKTIADMNWAGNMGASLDNGSLVATGDVFVASNVAVITVRKSAAGAWTGSGNKVTSYQIEYEI